jgi:hypothetical protein
MIVARTLVLAAAVICAGAFAEETPGEAPVQVQAGDEPSFVYPQRRELEGYSLVVHAPQIRKWPNFEHFEASIVIELTPPDGTTTSLGTATVTGDTSVDLANRVVEVTAPEVERVVFKADVPPAYSDVVRSTVSKTKLHIPLDLFLAYLVDDVLSDPPPPGFNTAPPVIEVRSRPTILLFVNGEPVPSEVPGTGLEVIVNANWPTLRDTSKGGAYYLLQRDRWLTSKKLHKGWKAAKSLPDGFARLPEGDEYAVMRQALPLKKSDQPLPKVLFADEPTELIVTEGKPDLEAVAGAAGLVYVANTENPLFQLDGTWYFLAAGRWFTTMRLDKGPWTYVAELPAAFEEIPDDHAMAAVLASVPGTVEARMAALEALIPTKQEMSKDGAPPIEVTYVGDPQFERVPGTEVSRAVNTGFDVLQFEGRHYLCYSGVWYISKAAIGPWSVTDSVPEAIYAIPPDSPSYHVTQVSVADSSETTVTYAFTPAYTSSVYVVYGVPYYGTGWYYPPYIYGVYYYPYWGSYGHGSWYNPATGGYGSRSVWYGPYGGYSYSQGYNPSTGRHGYVETAWDGDEWASHGETYNPRTGVRSETSRYYDEDKNQATKDRTVQRGDDWVHSTRTTDFDERTSSIQRETSGGGSVQMQRDWNDGTATSDGTITTGDGRTYSVSGEQSREGGSTTITGEGGSMEMNTKREDGRSVTTMEGSGGGQGISVSGQGPGRTTVAQSGSGDLYAGHDGNVYKKTEDGWQHFDNGEWSPADTPDRPDSGAAAERRSADSPAGQRPAAGSTGQTDRASAAPSGQPVDFSKQLEAARLQPRGATAGTYSGGYRQGGARDYSQLNRDHAARQRSNRQFQQRQSSFRGGGFRGGRRGRR